VIVAKCGPASVAPRQLSEIYLAKSVGRVI
jgi:hypothetical protein